MAKKYKYVKDVTIQGKRYKIRANSLVDLGEKIAKKKIEIESGKVTFNGHTLVKDWAIQCVEIYKTNQSDDTRKNYMYKLKNGVIAFLGNYQLKDVKPLHCQKCINQQSGRSKKHINDIYQIINFIFSKAVDNKMILENPAKNIIKPKGYVNHRRAITESERFHLEKVFLEDKRFLIFMVMLKCGCRPTEARMLQGLDVQKLDGVYVLHIKGTKSDNADRKVPLPNDLFPFLQTENPFSYIFANNEGKPISREAYNRLTKALYRAMNLSMGCKVYRNQLVPPLPLADDFVPYCLRHTYCTDLQKAGVDIRTAQYLMGHSDISLTANIYTHADSSTITTAAKLLNVASS